MRPFRSFLLLLIFLICFAGLSYILPWDLNLPKIENLIPKELVPDLFDTGKSESIPPGISLNDSVPNSAPADLKAIDSISVQPEPSSPDMFEKFLDSLGYSKRQVRIMYYGDSQIEGDRITCYLRHNLRERGIGGTGPGLFLPVMPVSYTKSVYVRASSNWERYNYLSLKNGDISHNKLGPFMAFCRYLPDGKTSAELTRAWIRIVPSMFADSSSSQYDYLRILYRNTRGHIDIEVKSDNFPPLKDSLKSGNVLNEFTCPLYKTKDILIEFSSKVSPDIYGISIESRTGLIIDNIPQRGSAGLEFTMVDSVNLRESFKLLHPDLVVLHYGLNIVRNIRGNYSYYEKGLDRQLMLLNEISPPGTKFLVVGLTDMAAGEGDNVKSYPNLPAIKHAQERAATTSHAFFWDAGKAMGGESSIIRWFGMNPPLAKKDYIHFTDQGADTLARIMISELFKAVTVKPDSITRNSSRDTLLAVSVPSAQIPAPESSVIPEKRGDFLSLISLIFSYDRDKPFIFSTPAFWIFFLVVLAVYSLLYKRLFIRHLYLFLVSLFFYYKTGGFFLILLIIVTLIDFSCGLLIYNSRTKLRRRILILVSIISNIGILAYFKYTGFFIHTLNEILGTGFVAHDYLTVFSNSILGTKFDVSSIVLPVGISFFTFQSLSYTIDVYRRKLDPVRNIIDFGFYVSFFPQLVAGPIVRASEFIPQLYRDFHLTGREFSHALFLISKGLIKKIIISDFIAVNFIDRVFDLPTAYSGFENLMAVYGYGLQIYCDFSGYTDIAIGLALILGFRLPLNFNSPYKATSVADFWKRWHISLSRWLKDYLYIPLGGNRKGKFRSIVNLMITMLLGGLWHGANLRFIIWGGLHGIGLVINRTWTYLFGDRTHKKKLVRAFAVFLTFQFISFCWIFFRAPDIHGVELMLRQIFGSFLPVSFGSLIPAYTGVFSLILAGYMIHFLPEKLKESYRGLFIKIPLAVQLIIIMVIAILLYQMRTSEIMPFIYFRF